MPRLAHGKTLALQDLQDAHLPLTSGGGTPAADLVARPADLHDFDYLFPDLAGDPTATLPEATTTTDALKALGQTMAEADLLVGEVDSDIPAAYTYFGQFVDHDTTLEVRADSQSGTMEVLLDPAMAPMDLAAVRNALRNVRTATLDLDSVYAFPAARDPGNQDKMRIGLVTPLHGAAKPLLPIDGKGPDNDLPREPRNLADQTLDRAALIGDPRNDENLIVAQLHVAFLKAHNALVDQGLTFNQARRVLRQHYQHIVLHDFLTRVCDPAVVDAVVTGGNQWFDATGEPFFLPLEYAVAAYRFGHSMVRGGYDYNDNFNFAEQRPASLQLLFSFTALQGQLAPGPSAGSDTLPENWVIQWENIIGTPTHPEASVLKTRRLDTGVAKKGANGFEGLFKLQQTDATPEAGLAAFLAVRNLLRGYRLRIPTGQAIATRLGITPLTSAEILAEASTDAQRTALTAGGFDVATPLWYYVLAEAGHGGGKRLGPVGSTLVAEVLVGLVRRSPDSVLRHPGWVPSLPSDVPGRFELSDLLRFAGVLAVPPLPQRRHVVVAGETLSGIALSELGDAARWPEIFVLNRAVLRDPDRIGVGQVLTLPSGPPADPEPRIHVVVKGDTLSGIAERELGDASRWPEIFQLNGAVITNPDVIVVGLVLVLPARQQVLVLPDQGRAGQRSTADTH